MPLHLLIAALIKILATVGYIMLAVPMIVWLERKLIADFQARVGPQRVGPFGLLQSFADGIKLVAKENLIPADVDMLLYLAAPVVVMIPALAVAAVIPFAGDLDVGVHRYRMVIADLPVAMLFVLALTSLSVYGVVLSGWASNNKYSLLGGLRSSAQMVAYELPMGMSLVAGIMIATRKDVGGLFSLSLSKVVDAQSGWFWHWTAFNPQFAFLGMLALITFYICGVAETNRAPFDLPEAESELIGGYHTEYGGLRWAMFFLGEYAAMLNVSAVATTVFLGGWHAPYPDTLITQVGTPLYFLQGLFWFGLKIYLIIVFYIHLRASLPRLRYDRLMSFAWKALLPTTLLNVMLVATVLTLFFPAGAPPSLTGMGAAIAAPGPAHTEAPPAAAPAHPGIGAGEPEGAREGDGKTLPGAGTAAPKAEKPGEDDADKAKPAAEAEKDKPAPGAAKPPTESKPQSPKTGGGQ